MNSWFRSWHGAPVDNKWLVISKRANTLPGVVSAIVWALFDRASQAKDRGSVAGFDVETYSAFSGFPEDEVQEVLLALEEKGVIVDGRLAAWNERQPKREDDRSTDRVRAFRKRNETQGNASEREGTNGNVPERDGTPDKIREEEIREEDKGSVLSSASLQKEQAQAPKLDDWEGDPRKELFVRGVADLKRLTGKPEPQVRTLIGKWLKDTKDEAVTVLSLIDGAAEHEASNAIPWIEGAIKSRNRTNGTNGHSQPNSSDAIRPPPPKPRDTKRVWELDKETGLPVCDPGFEPLYREKPPHMNPVLWRDCERYRTVRIEEEPTQ